MTLSVNSNAAALAALQNLNSTNLQMAQVQDEISTGLKVSDAKDNSAVWSIAQQQRSDVTAIDAATTSLNRANSIAQVALTAGGSVSDLLSQLREKVLGATDSSLDPTSRSALNTDFQSLLHQIGQVISGAEFDGQNLLDNSSPAGMQFMSGASGNTYLTLAAHDMTVGGSLIPISPTSTIGTVTSATNMLASIDSSLNNVDSALSALGAQSNQIDAHNTFLSKLSDVLTTGIGGLVDADMAKDGARLQALQVQQQLGTQALSIANSSPSVILSLFQHG